MLAENAMRRAVRRGRRMAEMARKISLPVAVALLERGPTPTVDAVRKRLGGRATSGPGIGDLVAVTLRGGARVGVILFAQGEEVHVLIGGGMVRKTRRALTEAASTASSPELSVLADHARVFDSLREGQRVRYEASDRQPSEGAIAEKCRFGALVLCDDGRVIGVGFRRLWPAERVADVEN